MPEYTGDAQEVEYRYPDVDIALDLYADLYGKSREHVRDFVREMNGLVSAQAASLAYGIAEGQVFLEGDKTAALALMDAFLRVNHYHLPHASDDDLYTWMRAIARNPHGNPPLMTEGELAAVLRVHLVSL